VPRQRRCKQPRTTKVVGMLSSTRSTDKRTMNILDLIQNTFTNTSIKFQGIFSTTLIRFPHIIPINTGSKKNCHFPFRQKFPSTLGIYDITGEETSPTGKNRHFDLLMVPLHFISEHDSLPLPIDQ